MRRPLAILQCLWSRIDWWALAQYALLCLAGGRALADFFDWLRG